MPKIKIIYYLSVIEINIKEDKQLFAERGKD